MKRLIEFTGVMRSQLQSLGLYKPSHGVKDWRFYDETGKLIRIDIFDELGNLYKTVEQ